MDFTGSNDALVALNQKMIMDGVPLVTIRELETDLEDMFMKITTGAVQ